MKLQEHSNKLQTNVESESQNFGIGDASKIIAILRDKLYEHKVRTLVQEYICNARDAMREAGKKNNFEVTVPTRLNPVFKVRDFGPGISPSRMANVFIMYGSSTKNNTDSQTGGFGIGAKSAWSYTDSFTIVSTVDGVRRTYVAHTGVSNNGRLDLIATDKTSEQNGTEIQVAVKPQDINEFRDAIFRAIYFWVDKPTLKGELNPPTLTPGDVISDLVEIVDKNLLPSYIGVGYHSQEFAVIDGIPYAINHSLSEKVKSLCKLNEITKKVVILHFGNGLVEVSASRESISDSKATVAALEKLSAKALLEVQTHIADAFGKVKTTQEYLKTYVSLSSYLDVDSFAKYKGYYIENDRIKSVVFQKVKMTLVHCMNRYGRSKINKITKDEFTKGEKRVEINHFNNLFFLNKVESKLVQNKRIREYFKTHTHMMLIELLNSHEPTVDSAGKPVLDKDNKQVFHPVSYPAEFKKVIADLGATDFSTITYVDPPRVVKAKVKREDAEICLHRVNRESHKYVTLASNTQKWIYVPLVKGGTWPDKYSHTVMGNLQDYTEVNQGYMVCGLAERAVSMVKGDKNFISVTDWIAEYKPVKNCFLSAKQQISRNRTAFCALAPMTDLEEPFLLEMIQEYKDMEKCKGSIPHLLATILSETKEILDFREADAKFGKLMQKEYPLVDELGIYSKNKKELTFYVNAKYKENKKAK